MPRGTENLKKMKYLQKDKKLFHGNIMQIAFFKINMIVENIVILALEDKVEKMTYKVKGDIY